MLKKYRNNSNFKAAVVTISRYRLSEFLSAIMLREEHNVLVLKQIYYFL